MRKRFHWEHPDLFQGILMHYNFLMRRNPNCDNDKCELSRGQVRVMPSGGDSNLILCRACWEYELLFRRDQNKELAEDCQFDLPTWKGARVYQ
jgi:hypothetical protein